MDKMYVYHITMKNGKEYDILTDCSNPKNFALNLVKPNNFNEYKLLKAIDKRNTILIRGDDVSSIEYGTE